ncbi:hypothetical protein [Faecalibaculum rodentium]|uniref:hypothetical protein n=1 Tax=Faecalibaculum rodentium TaxID=1702221 RepID=UPI0026184158|nr:hypothetical protein [Faecalibaculum rodentium]
MIQRVLPEVHDGQRRRFVFRLMVVKKSVHIKEGLLTAADGGKGGYRPRTIELSA